MRLAPTLAALAAAFAAAGCGIHETAAAPKPLLRSAPKPLPRAPAGVVELDDWTFLVKAGYEANAWRVCGTDKESDAAPRVQQLRDGILVFCWSSPHGRWSPPAGVR